MKSMRGLESEDIYLYMKINRILKAISENIMLYLATHTQSIIRLLYIFVFLGVKELQNFHFVRIRYRLSKADNIFSSLC